MTMTINRMAVAVYLLGAWLTFGWSYNRPDDCGVYWSNEKDCAIGNNIVTCVRAAFWPAYWTGRAAIEVTKP